MRQGHAFASPWTSRPTYRMTVRFATAHALAALLQKRDISWYRSSRTRRELGSGHPYQRGHVILAMPELREPGDIHAYRYHWCRIGWRDAGASLDRAWRRRWGELGSSVATM